MIGARAGHGNASARAPLAPPSRSGLRQTACASTSAD